MNVKSLLLTTGLLLPAAAAIDEYSIGWFKVAGGGGTSNGGNYALSGTIGQADAGGPLTGGCYSLTGGFWSSVTLVVQPVAPQLTMVKHSNGTISVRWPASAADWVLQQSTSLEPASWTDSTVPVAADGAWRSVTLVPTKERLFFRMRKEK